MTRHIQQMVLLAAGLLAGCAVDTPEVKTHQTEIAVKTNLTPMRKRANTINNVTALQGYDLRIDAYLHGTTASCLSEAKLKYVSSAWMFVDGEDNETHHYWPIEGSVHAGSGETVGAVDFVGYCPFDLSHTGVTLDYHAGNPQITCTLPMVSTGAGTTQANLEEFLWAYTGNQTKDSNSGTVDMTFKHPFARIKFQLSAAHPDITINTITLKSLKSGGTCSFDGSISTWSSLTPSNTVADLTVTPNQVMSTSESIQQIGTDYIVVPQTFAGDIEVNAGWTDWGETLNHNVSTTISSVTWQAGVSYTYTFTITEHDMIVDVDKFTEQW